jgi:hypothetical protein
VLVLNVQYSFGRRRVRAEAELALIANLYNKYWATPAHRKLALLTLREFNYQIVLPEDHLRHARAVLEHKQQFSTRVGIN